MACGQLPFGGCGNPDLGHTGPCTPIPKAFNVKKYGVELAMPTAIDVHFDVPKPVESDVEYTFVQVEKTGKWFLADPRKYEGDDDWWWCIHNGTMSHATLSRDLQWQKRDHQFGAEEIFVFEARNKTQVDEWLRRMGHPTNLYNNKQRTEDMPTARERKILAAQRTIERAQALIDRAIMMPAEPTVADDAPNVIYFQKKFSASGKVYDYAAVKAGDGFWYTTGPNTPKGYSWDDLIDWILDGANEDATVYQAKKFRAI